MQAVWDHSKKSLIFQRKRQEGSRGVSSQDPKHPARAKFTASFARIVECLESHLPAGKSRSARRKTALAIFSTLMGSLQLARAVNDPKLSDEVLKAGIETACAMAKLNG